MMSRPDIASEPVSMKAARLKLPIPFGKYTLLERINVGGMAEVFRAKAYGVEGFERFLAVKRILPSIAADDEFIEMFIDEAKIAVQLSHANIAQIFDLGKVEDSYFIALEHVHGKDLRAIFDACRAAGELMPIPQACFVVMKICEGLDYAHNKRDASGREMHLVHRDVSPQNVLLSYEGEIKLVDFGIAKAVGKASQTQAGILKGKFGYMSPEQVRGLPLDRRSDIFSVGIILYELLTGERLFLGDSDFATLEKVRSAEIPPPTSYNSEISSDLEQIVLRVLAKDLNERYQNAIDLHDDLQAYMYTAGEFYSRKDQAGWMKRTFAREIEEEGRRLESFQHVPVPDHVVESDVVAIPELGLPQTTPAHSPPVRVRDPASSAGSPGGPALNWDEDELETHIFDSPGGTKQGRVPPAEPESVASVHHAPEPGIAAQQSGKIASELISGARPTAVDSGSEAIPESSTNSDSQAAEPVPAQRPPLRPVETVLGSAIRPVGEPAFADDPDEARRHVSTVAPLPTADEDEPRRSATIYLVVLLLLLGLFGGSLYYFLVYLKRPATLELAIEPGGADVLLDSTRRRADSGSLVLSDVKPATHRLVVRKSGYADFSEDVRFAPGEMKQLSVALRMLTPGTLDLRTRPSRARVWFNGERLSGETPMRITKILVGEHTLTVKKEGFVDLSRTITIKPADRLEETFALAPETLVLHVRSRPRAQLLALQGDGTERELGMTPVKTSIRSETVERIALRREGYESWSQAILSDVKSRGVVTLNVSLRKAKSGGTASRTRRTRATGPVAGGDRFESRRGRGSGGQPVHVQELPLRSVSADERRAPAPGSSDDTELTARRPKQAANRGDGTLLVNTKPWTHIEIDGADTGLTTPQRGIRLPVGTHRLRLHNDKFGVDKTYTVFIAPNQSTKIVKRF